MVAPNVDARIRGRSTVRSLNTDAVGRDGVRTHRSVLPPGLVPIVFVLLLLAGIGPNLDLALLSIAVLLVGSLLLWRPGESPILLFAFALPWLQGATMGFRANWLGVHVDEIAQFPADVRAAILLTQLGLLVHAVGLRLGAGPKWRHDAWLMHEQAMSLPMRRWAQVYVASSVVSFAALACAWFVPGLSQVFLAFPTLKWAAYFMLAYAAFAGTAGGGTVLAIAFLFELALGVGGYFSDFKTIIFVTAFAAVAAGLRMTMQRLLVLVVLAGLALSMGIVWTAVKVDYRRFVSAGDVAQIVSVDYLARMNHLAHLVSELDRQALSDATDALLSRLAYVEYFGATLNHVPQYVPHQYGAILWDAVSRPFMPRLFFPNKEIIDDSARTAEFSGVSVGGLAEGTSISLGWIAEAYIDFGRYGMFLSILAVSMFFGWIYRALLRWGPTRGLLGSALATAVLLGASMLESSMTKVFGGVIVSLLVSWAAVRFLIPRVAPWLLARSMRRSRA